MHLLFCRAGFILILILAHTHDIVPDIIDLFHRIHIDLRHLVRLKPQFFRDHLDLAPIRILIAEDQLKEPACLSLSGYKRVFDRIYDRDLIEDICDRRVDHIFQR